MNITIFGATGRVGQKILQYALTDGHSVTALVRSPEKLVSHPNLTIIEGDARNHHSIREALQEANLVISTLGTDQTTVLTESITHIIQAMQENNMKRIVTIGTAGILQSRSELDKLRYQSRESKRRSTIAAKEHEKAYQLLYKSNLDWTIVCPTYLPDGEATKTYRIEKDFLPLDGMQISVGDTAYFAYNELFAQKYVHTRVGIAY